MLAAGAGVAELPAIILSCNEMKNRKQRHETAAVFIGLPIILLFRRRRRIYDLLPFLSALSGALLLLFTLLSYLSPPINSRHRHFISRSSVRTMKCYLRYK